MLKRYPVGIGDWKSIGLGLNLLGAVGEIPNGNVVFFFSSHAVFEGSGLKGAFCRLKFGEMEVPEECSSPFTSKR